MRCASICINGHGRRRRRHHFIWRREQDGRRITDITAIISASFRTLYPFFSLLSAVGPLLARFIAIIKVMVCSPRILEYWDIPSTRLLAYY